MMTADQWWLLEAWGLVLLAAFVVLGAWSLREHGLESLGPRWLFWGLAIAAAAALLQRTLLVEPAFVHHDFRGPQVLQGILSFPSPPFVHAYGEGHGPGHFIVVGVLSHLTGRSATGVMAANAVLSASTVLPVGFVASKLAGRPAAGLYAAAIWVTSPLVARLGYSEDAHVTAVLFGAWGLTFAFLAADAGGWRALGACVAATMFAVWTRQTLYAWSPLVAGVLVQRTLAAEGLGWRGPRARAAAAGGAAIVVLTLLRALSTAGSSDGREYLLGLGLVLEDPGIVVGWILDHPFLDVAGMSPVVTVLGGLGLYAVARRPGVRASFFAGFVLYALLTVPASFPGAGIRYAFRLPHYTLAIIVAGVGAESVIAWIAAWSARRRGRPPPGETSGRRAAGSAIALALLGAVGTVTLANRVPDAELVEYDYLERTLERLPPGAALIEPEDGGPAARIVPLMAHRTGVGLVAQSQLAEARADGVSPLLVFDGLQCHARSTWELMGVGSAPAGELPPDEEVRRIMRPTVDRRMGYGVLAVDRPTGRRRGCARLLAESVPYGPPGPVVEIEDEPPQAFYERGLRRARLGLYEWRGDVTSQR